MKYPIYLLAAVVITLSSCQKEPVANISADKTEVEEDETVMFTNTTTGGETYNWDFGDGTSSTDKEPVKSWSTAGTYIVTMTATSKNGKKTGEATITIKVNSKYLGTYSVSENWSSELCGGSTDNYTMTVVEGSSGTTVTINNYANLFNNVTGDMSDGKIIIPAQNTVIDGSGNTWDIDGGSINSTSVNVISVSVTINDIPYDNNCGNRWGTGTGTK